MLNHVYIITSIDLTTDEKEEFASQYAQTYDLPKLESISVIRYPDQAEIFALYKSLVEVEHYLDEIVLHYGPGGPDDLLALVFTPSTSLKRRLLRKSDRTPHTTSKGTNA